MLILNELNNGMQIDTVRLKLNYRECAMRTHQENRWFCNKADRKIAGVCSGIARSYGHNTTLIRALAVLAFLALPGVVLTAYVVAALILPSRYVV